MNKLNQAKLTNQLIDMSFNISENSMNLLAYILQVAYVSEHIAKTGAPVVYLERSKLVAAAGIGKNSGRLRLYLEELQTALFRYECDEITITSPLLCGTLWSPKLDVVSLEISRLLWPYLSEFVGSFTVFHLADLWQIKGRFAKRFYLDVMRWANSGTLKLNLDNLRTRYDTEYQYNDIHRRIIVPGIEQIHQLTNLTIHETEPTRRGKKVETLNFIIRKPAPEALLPLANDLVKKYRLEPAFAQKVVNFMAPKDIQIVSDVIDAGRHKLEVKNIAAYAATIFRSYGIKDNTRERANA